MSESKKQVLEIINEAIKGNEHLRDYYREINKHEKAFYFHAKMTQALELKYAIETNVD